MVGKTTVRELWQTVQSGLGLHLKLAFAGAVTVFVCIGLLSALLLYRQAGVLDAEVERASLQLRKRMVERGVLLAEGMAASMETAIAGYDFAFITDTVTKMQAKNEHLVHAFLTNAAGIIIVHTDAHRVGGRLESPLERKSWPRYADHEDGYKMVEIGHALDVGGREWGNLVLGFDLTPIETQAAAARERGRRVLARSTTLALLIGAVVGLLGLGASIWASRQLLQPVLQLAADAGAIGEGKLDHEISAIRSSDEIGVLARQFEAMRLSIKSYIGELVVAKQQAEAATGEEKRLRAEIEQHSRLLESKVSERTAELQAMNDRLTEYDRLKSEFLSNVSHELRSPLAAISSAAKIINQYAGGRVEHQQRFSGVIIEETGRLTRLINDLLDLSKIEAGKIAWDMEPVERPSELIEHVITTYRPLFAESGTGLTFNMDEDLPRIRADRDRLIQVFTNLLSNALKFTPQGGRVAVTAEHHEMDGLRRFRVTVTDSGPGIPVAEREQVFERFHQGATRDKPRGTGLGLAICREVIEHHGGRIWAEAPEAGGTRMVLTLPALARLPGIQSGTPATPTAT